MTTLDIKQPMFKRWHVDKLKDADWESTELRRQSAMALADGNITHQASTENRLDKEWKTLKERVSVTDKVLENHLNNGSQILS